MTSIFRTVFISFIVLLYSSCYSLKGISISPEVNTYYVETFATRDPDAPSELGDLFTNLLIQKINSNSKLKYSEENPHIEFSGNISVYEFSSVAPQEGDITAYNRIEIGVKVSFINNQDEKENWESTFSYFQEYSSDMDFSAVQDDLTEIILSQLTEDIFNRAFTNW